MTGMGPGDIRVIKKPRLVFTDIQRRTLHAIFKETKRPSKEMQVGYHHDHKVAFAIEMTGIISIYRRL